MTHRTVTANGQRIHLVEQGEGPLVVLIHGFPESWHSWHHQLPAIADAGFHAVAPDMRGYGRSSKPARIDDYRVTELVADSQKMGEDKMLALVEMRLPDQAEWRTAALARC